MAGASVRPRREAQPVRPSGASARPLVATLVGVVALVVSCATQAPGDNRDTRLVTPPQPIVAAGPPTVELDYGELSPEVYAAAHVTWFEESGEPAGVVARIAPVPSDGALVLPVAGLEDGRSYRARIELEYRAGTRVAVPGEVEVRLELGLPAPAPDETRIVTFSRRPLVGWTAPQHPLAVAAQVLFGDLTVSVPLAENGDSLTFSARPDTDLVSDSQFVSGATVESSARLVSTDGVLGPAAVTTRLVFDLSRLVPEPTLGVGGAPSLVRRPAVGWLVVDGAAGYDVELAVVAPLTDSDGQDSWEETGATAVVTSREVVTNTLTLDEELLPALEAADSRRPRIVWRVRARGPEGLTSQWSPASALLWEPLAPTMVDVLQTGGSVRLVLGDPLAGDSAQPLAEVELTRPFALARSELTNEVAAALARALVRTGEASYDDPEAPTALVDRLGRVLVGIGRLDFGRQYGLQVADGELVARSGYGGHPAIGISWFGAAAMANELSRREARQPVYELSESPAINRQANGYRLPTEAEWALAAATNEVPIASVDGDRRVAEARGVSGAELRGVNYLRSGDRWEALTEPFDAQGGPTSPVGALGYLWSGTFRDLLGNVWEWTDDWYDADWYTELASGQTPSDPVGPPLPTSDIYGRTLRVVRGSAWNTPRGEIRPGTRGSFDPAATSHSIGVRLARTLTDSDSVTR